MAPPRLTWSFDMRLLVDMLYDKSDPESSLTPTQRTHAFNLIFKDQIRAFCLTDGVSHRTLNAQYGEKKKRNPDWTKISGLLSPQEEERKQSLWKQLQSIIPSSRSNSALSTPASRTEVATSVSKGQKRHADLPPTYQETSTPLSKRRAVGSWMPEPGPVQSTPLSRLEESTLSDQRQTISPKAPEGPRLAVPTAIPWSTATPRTPRKRPDGKMILMRVNEDLRQFVPSISQHRAQPPIPKLLFRLWQQEPGSSRNSCSGFWSRRHHMKNALSQTPPQSSSIDATDILDHMDRREVDTPFISTSNRLIWIIQQALTALKTDGDYNVSVIDTEALDKRGVYWARPFHDEVRLSKGFSNGAGNYRGTFEFLIFQKIPGVALLHTFKARDLVALAVAKEMSHTLRFEVLRTRDSLASKLAALRRQNVPLSQSAVEAIAGLASFFGLTAAHKSSIGHLSALVTGICEGWGLKIHLRSEQEWQRLANHFANQLGSFELPQRQNVKLAFLDGVAWGCGEPNARHTVASIERKVKKATAVGLASPCDILAHELDALRLALKLHQKADLRSLLEYHHRPFHSDPTLESERTKQVGDVETDDDERYLPDALDRGEQIMFESEN